MSGILYPILILTLFLIVQILAMMASRKTVLDKNKQQLLDSVNLSNKIYTNEELSILLAEQQEKIKILEEKQNNTLNSVYPVGSIYKSTTNQNPSTLFGGTWEVISADYDIINVGSQVIYSSHYDTTTIKKPLLGSYDYQLADGIFENITVPSGYQKRWRMSVQHTNGNGAAQAVMLNEKEVIPAHTAWSANTYRRIIAGDFFNLFAIPLEPTYQYKNPGINLYTKTTLRSETTSTDANYYNITVHGFLQSKNKMYTYRRIS